MITIDEQTCIGCGACVADCFPEALALEAGKVKLVGACIECGHCFAVCPTGAVDMGEDYPRRDVVDFNDWQPEVDSDTLLALLKARRSIRRYEERPVARETLSALLEAGRFTPTGSNSQNVRYTVIQESLPEIKAKVWEGFGAILDGYAKKYDTLMRMKARHEADASDDRLFFNAPVLLVVSSPHALNAGLAASSIALMAESMGLGTLYSGFIQMALSNNPALCDELALAPEEIAACLLVGYPAVHYERTAPRRPAVIDWR